jgi:hypothetical protein
MCGIQFAGGICPNCNQVTSSLEIRPPLHLSPISKKYPEPKLPDIFKMKPSPIKITSKELRKQFRKINLSILNIPISKSLRQEKEVLAPFVKKLKALLKKNYHGFRKIFLELDSLDTSARERFKRVLEKDPKDYFMENLK